MSPEPVEGAEGIEAAEGGEAIEGIVLSVGIEGATLALPGRLSMQLPFMHVNSAGQGPFPPQSLEFSNPSHALQVFKYS
jgi:hypothetical protein